MPAAFDSLKLAALFGLAAAVLLIAVAGASAHWNAAIVLALVLRIAHVLLAAVWIGLIVFMNVIHIPAIEAADDAGRAAILKGYVPRIASSFLHLAHGTVVSGLLLLVPAGYALSRLVYGTSVYIPPGRNIMLGIGILGGLAMWAVVFFVVAPRLKQIADPATAPGMRGEARGIVKRYARLNLTLLLPVTAAMIAAAHVL